MKFIKSFKIFEAKTAVDKDEIKGKVLLFLFRTKGINTQAQVYKGAGLKNSDQAYNALIDLQKDGKVDHVEVKDYSVQHMSNHPKWYPHYYATDSLTKEEAKKLAKELEEASYEENKEANYKRKEAISKAIKTREEKRETASKARATKKDKKEETPKRKYTRKSK